MTKRSTASGNKNVNAQTSSLESRKTAPSYAEVADLFNALEVIAADACMEDVSLLQKIKWYGSGLSPVGNPSKVIFEVHLMRR